LSDSDPDVGSDDDGCSSEAEKQGGLSVRMNNTWDPVDEQRLLAYKKEDKSWEWIFKKFPGRAAAAVARADHGTAQSQISFLPQVDRQQLKTCVPTY
jgi:hypothetical protein